MMKNRFNYHIPGMFVVALFLIGCASTTPKRAYKASDQSRIYEIGQQSELEILDVGNYNPAVDDRLLAKAEPFIPIVKEACNQLKIDIAVTMAVIERESGFNPDNENPSDPSYGLMQLVPESGGRSANRYIYGRDAAPTPSYLFNPRNNIFLGVGYLSMMKNYYYGDVKDSQSRQMCMIGGYNAGPGGVARSFGVKSVDAAVIQINRLNSNEVYQKLIKNLPKGDHYNAREYLRKIYETVPKWTFLRFSDEMFYNRINEIEDPTERIALCKEYIENSGNINVLCDAQDIWVGYNKAEALEYFKAEYAGNPGNVASMFLLGRVIDDPIRRIDLGRDIIWYNDKLSFGYRLLIETYVKYLFNNQVSGNAKNELQRLVKSDRKYFKKLTYLIPEEEYPFEWLYIFQMFSQDYSDARSTIKRAKKRNAKWATSEKVIASNLLAGKHGDVLKEVKSNVDYQIGLGTFSPYNRERYIRINYTNVLRSIGAYKPIIKFLEKYPKDQRDTEIILELAKYYALCGRHDKAFRNLFWALEDLETAQKNNQKCYWKRLTQIDDLWVLYTDSQWGDVLKLEAELFGN